MTDPLRREPSRWRLRRVWGDDRGGVTPLDCSFVGAEVRGDDTRIVPHLLWRPFGLGPKGATLVPSWSTVSDTMVQAPISCCLRLPVFWFPAPPAIRCG